MARPNFFNENSGRSFPFVKESLQASGSSSNLDYLPDSTVVDFGADMGVLSGFDESQHKVELAQIRRAAGNFYFYFTTTAPDGSGYWLIFTRSVGETEYVTEYAVAIATSNLDPVPEESALAGVCGEMPVWSGYLVTGDLSGLAAMLPADGTLTSSSNPQIEPALIRNQRRAMLRGLNLANADRTRADTPDHCRDLVWKYTPDTMYVRATCLTGPIRLEAGYNVLLIQSDIDNGFQIEASVGAGAGEVCGDVPLFDGDMPPLGGTTLDGADSCNDVIRGINGAGGRIVPILSGPGVTVTPQPAKNQIDIAVDLSNLKLCIDLPEPVDEESCSFPPEESISCGPA